MAFLNSRAIPDKIAKMMRPADRKEIGKGATTLDEAITKEEKRAERLLQKQLLAILEAHRRIVVIYSRMDRKTTTPLGTPDLIFAVDGYVERTGTRYRWTYACAWECKTLAGEQTKDQVEMEQKMTTPPNAWTYRIIRSVQQARDELSKMGLE